ncbi:MAG: AlpA family phage regulatory protein [Pseudomonadota bacterium]|jgi:prophage regulatory protein
MSTRKYLTDHQAAERYGVSRTTPWRWTSAGLFPPPIRLSPGCTRWLSDEIELIDQARLAGKTDAEIRELVHEIMNRRQSQAA